MAPDTYETTRTVSRTTFAIGLFDNVVAVQSALRDLANHGFGGERVRVFTASEQHAFDAVDGDAPAAHRRLSHVSIGAGIDASDWISDMLRDALSRSIERSPGMSRPHDGNASSTDYQFGRFAMSGLDRQTDTLKRHLDNGGSVVIIALDDTSEHHAVCSMLLHYASHGVQTHQLRSRRGS